MDNESTALQTIQTMFQLQEERVHTFKLFEEGFNIHMTNSIPNVVKFRKLVKSVTKDFKRISAGISKAEQELLAENHHSIASSIGLLQRDEETHLQLCAKLQIAKQDALDNPHMPDKWNQVATLKELYNKIVQQVSDRVERLRTESEYIQG